jgi:hypothetical protein
MVMREGRRKGLVRERVANVKKAGEKLAFDCRSFQIPLSARLHVQLLQR